MRQHFLILIFLVLVIAALVGLNAVSYTKIEQKPDSELDPNRSSFNSGSTGSSAFYTLLAETGNKVVRWQQPPSALLSPVNDRVKTLVLIGQTRRFVTDEEAGKILLWVSRGGRLVLIDRYPNLAFLKTEHKWRLIPTQPQETYLAADPADTAAVTDKTSAAKPVQPSILIKGITAVQPSRFASSITLKYSDKPEAGDTGSFKIGAADDPPPPPSPSRFAGQTDKNAANKEAPPPAMDEAPKATSIASPEAETPAAPVIHLSNTEKDILADYPYGQGRVIFLSDPYIVSNTGIKLVDNATLAINMVAVKNGTIAFDEYHQGFGNENSFLRYFSGTPVPALLAQGILLIFVLIWTRGRRFARPLPVAARDRRSKLEYIAAMADLQQSTRAYDLAIENIYTQTKRDMARLAGADNTISRKSLAEAVAERTGFDAKELYKLMAKCEDIIHGEPTNAKETMNLISQLRALEDKLGLHRNRNAGREIKK
jgi:hypothetical protein